CNDMCDPQSLHRLFSLFPNHSHPLLSSPLSSSLSPELSLSPNPRFQIPHSKLHSRPREPQIGVGDHLLRVLLPEAPGILSSSRGKGSSKVFKWYWINPSF